MSTETLQFRTELKQLLHLIIHSLYSHKDIFLRELISNASDAIDRVRFQGLTQADVLEGNADWKIRLIPDEKAGTLTISDNGIGMSRETIVENLGTIAKSGTREFLDQLKKAGDASKPDLIGQFGVGFYSSFMVADKVTVVSRMAGPTDHAVRWESEGQGEFTLETCTKETRGTDITLHLREDSKEFLNSWKLRELVKKYSDFVEHPVATLVPGEGENAEPKEETLNAQKAIWLRSKSEISDQEYNDFYKHLSHDHQEPLKVIPYNAEGNIEFKSLLYLPKHKPFDLLYGDSKKGLHLYIQRVFILDDCETLLPKYLRFVRGVVDSPDLPLNVSREILQQSAPLEKIKSNLTNKILGTLDDMKRKEYEQYLTFYQEFGVFLKEGAYQDYANKQRLADLLLFESTKTDPGKFTTLADYVERMPGDQTEIFFLAGETRELLEQSPLLESFKAKSWEVLLLSDPADEFVVDSLWDYKGKKLKAVDRSEDSGKVDDAQKEKLKDFVEFVKSKVNEVKEVRLTHRLKESAVCLVAEDGGMSANMERILKRMGRDQGMPANQRILEINPDHQVIGLLHGLFLKDRNDARLEAYARLLYDQALIAEGSKIPDPAAFAKRLNGLIAEDLS